MSPVQAELPCQHRYRIAEQIDPITHRWPAHCVHCGADKAFDGGDPDNPFAGKQSWGRKLGELGQSGQQHNRREIVLNAEASGAFAAQKREIARKAPPRRPQHGTRNEYAHHDCRCEPCTEANREYYNVRNAAMAAKRGEPAEPLEGARHGTIHGYATDKCRCAPCREAMTVYCRERRQKLKKAAS